MFLDGFLEFKNFKKAYQYLLDTVLRKGKKIPEQNCIETFGVAYRIIDARPSTEILQIVGIPLEWAEKRIQD